MTIVHGWLFDAVSSDAEIVTANKRLARELRRTFDEHQLSRGLRSWQTPQILPWGAWINTLLDRSDQAAERPLQLHPLAAAVVWKRLLKDHAEERLLNADSLVRQAQQTWRRIQEWCISPQELQRHAVTDDERLFADLAVAYQRDLETHGWIDYAQLTSWLTTLVEAGRIETPSRVDYAGFDRLSPAVQRLLDALQAAGTQVTAVAGPDRRPEVRVASCADSDSELRAAGLWARQLALAGPGTRIAIVCPGLEQDAPRAARLVREGLAPGWQYAGLAHAKSVNVSYGRRLAAYPLVAVALLWLRWACGGLSTRDISVLLRSAFAGSGSVDARCRLEMRLRRFPDRTWRPASLSIALREATGNQEGLQWLQRVDHVAELQATAKTLDSPAAWAGRIDQLLQALGWPGERAPDTEEFQLANRWRDLLNELSTLEIVQPRIDLSGAVLHLTTLAAETIYQPETEPGVVQLFGTLEAAGLQFDNLWVCHLDAGHWPPQSHPLSLVSRALQRKLDMPDATPTDTLEFSRQVLERLAASAASVTFSWPQTEADLELVASPLLAPYKQPIAALAEDPGWHATSLCGSALEAVQDDPVPAFRPHEKLHGGAGAIQRQVTEPFSAFVYGRLGVKDLEIIEEGLPASTRGNIVHRALHHLLREKPASKQIAGWSTDTRARIEEAVDVALRPHVRLADGVLLRLLAMERRRLRALLQEFLDIESQRQDFQVLAVEESARLLRHGVEIDLRIDRIDRLADGTLLIVDYKTGAVKTLLTKDGEPKELQLVVYASAMQGDIGGLVLINVDTRQIVYKGAGGSVEWNPLPADLWQQRLEGWLRLVDNALVQLAAGDVRLNTRRMTSDSRPLNVLSRVEELKRGR